MNDGGEDWKRSYFLLAGGMSYHAPHMLSDAELREMERGDVGVAAGKKFRVELNKGRRRRRRGGSRRGGSRR